MSLRHEGQFSGSFRESSGCGSKIICPSAVFFFSSIGPWFERCTPDGSERNGGRAGLIEMGKDEEDLRSGVLERPRGALYPFSSDKRRMEP